MKRPHLHLIAGLGVLGEEADRVKAQVARLVVVAQRVEVSGGGLGPAQAHTVGLADADDQQQGRPECGTLCFHLLEVIDSRPCSIITNT